MLPVRKGMGVSPTYDQWSFVPVLKFLYLLINQNSTLTSMRGKPNSLA